MPDDKYCLRWQAHEKNLRKLFRNLRSDEHFCDVTVACEDLQFQAHKVVLSASSQFFNSILVKHSHPYPLLYLSGVKASDMKSLLDFMYSGEVTVDVDRLQSFIAAAKELKIQGLNINQSQELQCKLSVQPPSRGTEAISSIYNDDLPPHHMNSTAEEGPILIPDPLLTSVAPTELADEFWDGLACPPAPPQVPRIKPLFSKTIVKTEANLEEPYWLDLTSPNGGHKLFKVTQKIKDEIQSMQGTENVVVKEWKDLRKFVVISKRGNMQTGDRRTYQCTICGYTDRGSAVQVQMHVERAHFKGSFSYSCDQCAQQFCSKYRLDRHMREEHNRKSKSKELSVTCSSNQKDKETGQSMDPSEVKEWSDLKSFIASKEKGKRGPGGKSSTLECTLCGRTDWRRTHLMNHIEQKHFRKKFVYSCSLCGARPSTKHALECHMREKHNQKPAFF